MGLIERIKNICLSPKTEWPVIESEAADAKTLYTTYIMVLAAIPAVASLLSMSLLGMSEIGRLFGGIGLGLAATAAIVDYVMSLIMVFVIAFIADVLAPIFDGQKNMSQALKLTAYSMTAAWLAGIFNIIPVLGSSIALLGSLYSLYLFYLGSSVMMKVPNEQKPGRASYLMPKLYRNTFSYTLVIGCVAIVAGIIISFVVNGMVIGMGT